MEFTKSYATRPNSCDNQTDRVCSICSSGNLHDVHILYDDRYGFSGIFPLLKCQECGHRQIVFCSEDKLPSDLYSRYYPRKNLDPNDYRTRIYVSGLSAWLDGEYASAFRWVPTKVKVLDIGCGTCEALGYHLARGCDASGVEADTNIQPLVDKFGFKVFFGSFDPNNHRDIFFDYITLDQVIEHIEDPVSMLQGVSRILRPGGKVIISTPNPDGWGAVLFKKKWINWHVPYHMHFFSITSIKIAAEKAGLVIEEAKTISSSHWLHLQWLHLISYPSVGKPSLFWSQAPSHSYREKFIKLLLSLIHRLKINHLITRFFDGLGFGDNSLIILGKPL